MPMGVAGGRRPRAAWRPRLKRRPFSAILTEVGADKINVIKVVREVTSLGPRKQGPRRRRAQADQGGVPKDEAARIKKKSEEVGAKVRSSKSTAPGAVSDDWGRDSWFGVRQPRDRS